MQAAADTRPITHKRVFKIAAPIVLSNATVPILGAVDVGVVGQLGQAAPIAAVALGAIVITTLYWFFGFLRMGTAGLVGQAAGAGDTAEVSAFLTRAIGIAVAAGALMILIQIAIFDFALWVAAVEPEVDSLARTYLKIRIWSAPFAIAVFALTGWLIAMERTIGVFYVQLAMNGLNIALDFIFVLGFGWGVGGVAFATVIAETLGAGVGLYLCRDAFTNPAWRDWLRVFDRDRLIRMAAVNRDIFLRSAMLMGIFTSFVFVGARFGTVVLAANEVLIQFLYITAHAMDGFAFAAETLIARAFGQGNVARLRKSAVMTSQWGMGICVLLAVFFWLAGPWLIDVMTTSDDVRVAAKQFLFWMVIAPPLGCAAWMLDGIFIGATQGRDMRNMMAISFVVYWGSLAILMPLMGNHGLWLALVISFITRGITLGWRYPALERAALDQSQSSKPVPTA